MIKWLWIICFTLWAGIAGAQPLNVELYHKATLQANQEKLYRNLVQHTINKNLSLALTDSTEDNWQDAMQAMQVLQYKTSYTNDRIAAGVESLLNRSSYLQRAMLEYLYSNQEMDHSAAVQQLFSLTDHPKVFAMCAVYLLQKNASPEQLNFLTIKTRQKLQETPDHPILLQLQYYISTYQNPEPVPAITELLHRNFLPGNVILYSFQRRNRDYPGLAVLKDANGNFIKDSSGNVFNVPQLARSVSNLPGFLTNGNTPEGIYRMDKFDVSVSSFIGPTPNVQLSMPFEKKAFHYFQTKDSSDTTWNIERYKLLLPINLRNYTPLLQTWYAGQAGRTEIIAHGSTVNPAYYKEAPYFPLTPTQGCLATTEIWNPHTGKRAQSDQQKLVTALLMAGGARGYAVVINLDDQQKAITLADILPLLKQAGQQ